MNRKEYVFSQSINAKTHIQSEYAVYAVYIWKGGWMQVLILMSQNPKIIQATLHNDPQQNKVQQFFAQADSVPPAGQPQNKFKRPKDKIFEGRHDSLSSLKRCSTVLKLQHSFPPQVSLFNVIKI